ncbi:MAG: hypothetical protein WAV04_02090 [Candidatus Microsaccharimonas sp.]|jgi:hypothetical protein
MQESEPKKVQLTGEKAFVAYKGTVEQWDLTNDINERGRVLVRPEADGDDPRPARRAHESGGLSPEVQAALAEQYAAQQEKLGHGALENTGVDEPAPETKDNNPYDRLMDPNYDGSDLTVEGAAIHKELSDEEKWIEENIRRPARVATRDDAINNRADDYKARK